MNIDGPPPGYIVGEEWRDGEPIFTICVRTVLGNYEPDPWFASRLEEPMATKARELNAAYRLGWEQAIDAMQARDLRAGA